MYVEGGTKYLEVLLSMFSLRYYNRSFKICIPCVESAYKKLGGLSMKMFRKRWLGQGLSIILAARTLAAYSVYVSKVYKLEPAKISLFFNGIPPVKHPMRS